MKKVISLLAVFIMALTAAVPSFGAGESAIYIRNAQELCELSEKCTLDSFSEGIKVVLADDIDLTGADFRPIPFFAGSFDGGGHTISGFELENAASTAGLFRIIAENGTVRDLNVTGNVTPQGTAQRIGGIAGENRGRIISCSFSGTVKGSRQTGGICGSNESGGMISGCSVSGIVEGDHETGGICGENAGCIRQCLNHAQVNTDAPEIIEQETADIIPDLSLSAEEIIDITDIGGIAGYSSGNIKDCTNDGEVGYIHAGYNIGGICGHQSGIISGCSNSGRVVGRKDVGGITGQLDPLGSWNFSGEKLNELKSRLEDIQDSIDKLVDNTEAAGSLIASDVYSITGALSGTEAAARMMADNAAEWAGSAVEEVNDLSEFIVQVFGDLETVQESIDSFKRNTSSELIELKEKLTELADLMGSNSEMAAADISELLSAVQNIESLITEIKTKSTELRERIRALGQIEPDDAEAEIDGIKDDLLALKELPGRLKDAVAALKNAAEAAAEDAGDNEDLKLILEYVRGMSFDETSLNDLIGSFDTIAGTLDSWGGVDIPQISNDSEARDSLFESLGNANAAINSLAGHVSGSSLMRDVQGISDDFFSLTDFLMKTIEESRNEEPRTIIEDISADYIIKSDGSFELGDVSEGLIEKCSNRSEINADTNTGGIAGAVTMELAYDPEDELNVSAVLSDEARYLIFAAVKDCSNFGNIYSRKTCAGGIAGRMDYGAVSGCESGGNITSDGEYSGGIVALSSGTVMNSFVRGNINGTDYIGGIAGKGLNIYGCQCMPNITGNAEYMGSVAGEAEGEIYWNYYAESDIGGVNGFSYEDAAQWTEYGQLYEGSGRRNLFGTVNVTFASEDSENTEEVPYGGSIDKLPDIPDKDGKYWKWDEADLTDIRHNITVTGSYVSPVSVIATEGQIPDFLAEGKFFEGDKLTAEDIRDEIAGKTDPEQIDGACRISAGISIDMLTVHMRMQDEVELFTGTDTLNPAEYSRDGSYIVFNLENGGNVIWRVKRRALWPYITGGAGAAAVIALIIILITVNVRKKRSNSGEHDDKDSDV